MTRLDEQKKKGEKDNERDSVSLTEAFPDPTIILLISKKKEGSNSSDELDEISASQCRV